MMRSWLIAPSHKSIAVGDRMNYFKGPHFIIRALIRVPYLKLIPIIWTTALN